MRLAASPFQLPLLLEYERSTLSARKQAACYHYRYLYYRLYWRPIQLPPSVFELRLRRRTLVSTLSRSRLNSGHHRLHRILEDAGMGTLSVFGDVHRKSDRTHCDARLVPSSDHLANRSGNYRVQLSLPYAVTRSPVSCPRVTVAHKSHVSQRARRAGGFAEAGPIS